MAGLGHAAREDDMAESESEATEECRQCEGHGKHGDVSKVLVQVTCDRCAGSGTVPKGSQTESDQYISAPRKIPFQGARGPSDKGT